VARDAELDRLKTAQDTAFQRKQEAHRVMQQAWERRDAAREALNRAHDAKQHAYTDQDASWQSYDRIRSSNGPRIDQLNRQQETAYQNMRQAFDNASSAHDRRDGAGARSYADEGHRYKAESQGHVAERRRLVAEIRAARDQHEATKPAFQRAKDAFSAAKRTFDQAKAEHERAQADFKQAKEAFDQTSHAFKTRLDKVKADNKRRSDDKRQLAEKAGVPLQYRDKVWTSVDPNGNTNLYFGGVGKPNGPGHGHYVMNRQGEVTYKRDPFDPHGAHNFEENRREDATRRMAQLAMNQWAKSYTTPRMTQHEDSDFKVTVRSGHDRRRDAIVTDVLIFDKHNPREHYHLIIDEHGNELFSEWRPNH
jgi:hypothetical protein